MKKKLSGIIVSNKMTGTVAVRVERKFRHPKYSKVITRHKVHLAHVVGKIPKINEHVEIEECRPVSKRVHFVVTSKTYAEEIKVESKKIIKKNVTKKVISKK